MAPIMGIKLSEVMIMKQLKLFKLFFILLGLASGSGFIGSQQTAQAETKKYAEVIKTEYQYAAKITCSLLLPHQDGALARGIYRTTVNIHNPTNKKLSIAAKVALATQFGSEPGPFDVTPFKGAELQPDGAVGINCFDIASYFCPIDGVCVDFAFLEGFLVVKSPAPLDVVSVYSARHTESDVESIAVETVPPRKIQDTVKLGSTEHAKPGEGKRIDYPPKGSAAYSDQKPKQMCGGIAGFPCPEGMKCVDDPSDNCDPTKGDADCAGMCVK
ncbi:MAG: Kazal-type serine protease inhibitor domain protein [Nitrosomonas sp.]|nr:Kazal-type serine protease inhibitor domain protein [Nitrosomonas sp.]